MPVERCDEPLSVDLEIARWMAGAEARLGRRPTVLFRRIVGYPGSAVLGNPYPRQVLLQALGIDETGWPAAVARRLDDPAPGLLSVDPRWSTLSGLHQLPVVQHRPGDAGRYITAGVAVTRSLSTSRINLGVYRVQVVGPHRGRVFFDPRTDAHRNWQEAMAAGVPLPIAIFLGADPVFMLIAASRLPAIESDYDIAARLLGRNLELAGDPPVPTDAAYAVFGDVTGRLELEGPFGEFKGYYVEARESPVLEVRSVLRSETPVYPTIVTGRESGLTLMALQNEYLLHAHLQAAGFPVRSVRYPLESFGEYVVLIESDQPSAEIVDAAMTFDLRAKLILCGRDLSRPWQALATHGFEVRDELYLRKGRAEGRRLGLLLDHPPEGRPVEY
ncbi:MAG: UbiD family decarboxylase domain-containing protein [Thermoanaerobaculia bacterium]